MIPDWLLDYLDAEVRKLNRWQLSPPFTTPLDQLPAGLRGRGS